MRSLKPLASGGQSSPKLTPTQYASSYMPEKGLWTRTYSSTRPTRLHTQKKTKQKKNPRLVIKIFKCTSSHTLLSGCSSGDLFILICRHTIYWKVRKQNGILDCEKWYKHQSEPFAEPKEAGILWDFSIQTDRKIKNNKPDLVVKDYKSKTRLLIEMSMSTDNNISIKEYDKLIQWAENRNWENEAL